MDTLFEFWQFGTGVFVGVIISLFIKDANKKKHTKGDVRIAWVKGKKSKGVSFTEWYEENFK